MKEANNSGASGVILHVYEDHYPSCFFMRIRSGREYKPEGFKKNAKGKWVVDNTLDHGKDSSSHFDPEWKHLTYGEVPFENPKACMRKLKRGDYIFFNCNLRRCKSKSNFSRCTKRGKVSWPSCEDKGEKSWYIIGFFRLKEDPVTVFKLVKDGKANKSPYKYNEHIRHKTREDEPRSNYIFVGSKERSKRFQFPFPLTWQSARNYGITVHHHKRDKTNLERLKDTYRCKWIKSDGIKKLLRDISDFHSVR